MPLTFRATQPKDFLQCFNLLPERFLFKTPKSRAELFAFWQKTLADHSATSVVIEEDGKPKGKNIVGFALCFFASDDFAREAQTTLPPFLILQVMKQWKGGSRKNPFLNRRAVAHHNAHGGLTFAVLHYAVEPRKTVELEMPVRLKLFQSYMSLYGGFQLKQTFQEAIGLHDKELLLQAGLLLRRDYAESVDQSLLTGDSRPFLAGITQDEAIKKPTFVGQAFIFHPPRLGFTRGEQDVLEKALWGEIDKNIAPALGLTVWAVDKRWQRIYAKVEKVDHSILGPLGKKNDAEYQKTRRKYLLDYLRTHLEELRPYATASKPKKKNSGNK